MIKIDIEVGNFEIKGKQQIMTVSGEIIDKKLFDFIKNNYNKYTIHDYRPTELFNEVVNKRLHPDDGIIKSRKSIAKALGMTLTKYKKIEMGEEPITYSIAVKLAKYYNCSYTFFL